ncbi:MAG: tRNA 2-selenouridine(34) synthase MnmH [Burkholderiaceae bacterium]
MIDARSPSEFAIDHIPGAVNCPVLSDDERRIVGTLYKEQGPFEARRVGGGLVAANLARHLATTMADRPAAWKPIVYCWRGGLRSGAMVQWLRLVGWDARQLSGGYKQYRKHVIRAIETIAPQLQLRVLCGPTGSAKTRVLQALAAAGEQTIDLEASADHKGSVLGGLPGVEQPTQKRFENRIATALEGLDLSRPVYVEAESRKIGKLALPTPLLDRMRDSPCVEIVAGVGARLAYLLRDYAYLGDDAAGLAAKLATLHGLQSNETLARWRTWALAHELSPLFRELMTEHYDPLYARSQHGNFLRLHDAVRIEAASLEPDDMTALATRIAGLEAGGRGHGASGVWPTGRPARAL